MPRRSLAHRRVRDRPGTPISAAAVAQQQRHDVENVASASAILAASTTFGQARRRETADRADLSWESNFDGPKLIDYPPTIGGRTALAETKRSAPRANASIPGTGVPPFDHVTCPSFYRKRSSGLPSEQTAPGIRVGDPARAPGIPVVQLRENGRGSPRRMWVRFPSGRAFRRAVEHGLSVKREIASGFKSRPSRQHGWVSISLLACRLFGSGRCTSVIVLVAQSR